MKVLFCAVLFLPLVCASPPRNRQANREKLVILIQKVSKLREHVKNLVARLDNAEKTKIDLSKRLTSSLEKIKQLKARRKERRQTGTPEVAFYAALRHSLHALQVQDPIIFDDVYTLTSPDIYNDISGIFTAPVSGVYCFSWTNNVDATDYQSTELVIDDKPFGWAYADTKGDNNEDDYGSSSQTIVLEVKKGGHVWIRTGAQGKGTLHGEDYSTFTGFLLFPTTPAEEE